MDMPERIAKLEAQVETIKEDVAELKGDVKELHSRITHGNREILEKIECMDGRLEERLRQNASASATQHKEIEHTMRIEVFKISDRVDVLERWRWMIVGGAIVLGYLVSHLDVFAKVFGK